MPECCDTDSRTRVPGSKFEIPTSIGRGLFRNTTVVVCVPRLKSRYPGYPGCPGTRAPGTRVPGIGIPTRTGGTRVPGFAMSDKTDCAIRQQVHSEDEFLNLGTALYRVRGCTPLPGMGAPTIWDLFPFEFPGGPGTRIGIPTWRPGRGDLTRSWV
eukprot:3598022-Rhodomonas_salina.1